MKKQIAQSEKMTWKPLIEEGVKTDGIYSKVLCMDEEGGRPVTFLLKFEPGASYPNHDHPAGEEVYLLEGEVRFGPDLLQKGDYLYTPPGHRHSVFSKSGCVMLFVVPEEIEILS